MSRAPAGRPRDSEIDRAILDAALELLESEGYSRMSVERVAATAGVGKPAVYLRHRNKKALVLAALARLEPPPSPPRTGDVRADLVSYLGRLCREPAPFFRMSLVGTLIAEEPRHPELLDTLRDVSLAQMRQELGRIVQEGIGSGVLREDLPIRATVDLLIGAYYGHYLTGESYSPDWSRRVVDSVWTGISTRGKGPTDG